MTDLLRRAAIAGALSACLAVSSAHALHQTSDTVHDGFLAAHASTDASATTSTNASVSGSDSSDADAVEALVPEVANDPWKLTPGTRPFAGRFTFSAAYGSLGNHRLYTLRAAYNPNAWLGYEASIGHNPGDAVHALFHTFSAHLRYPLPWRLQPYATVGFGQAMVFPGASMNADPVTENVFTAGGGLEIYIRDDVALRGEMRQATVFGSERGSDETIRYDYGEATIGFAFHRRVRN